MSEARAGAAACAGGSDRAHLLGLMAILAAGDGRAAVALAVDFRVPLARVVRRHLARQGVVHPTVDDVDGLTFEAAFEIAECAASWNPHGALPWVWADRRIAAAVARHVGQHADPYDPDVHSGTRGHDRGPGDGAMTGPGSYAGPDPLLADVLATQADRDPTLGLLRAALELVTSPRDQAVLLEYAAQGRAGNRSPAHTVGDHFALAPATVRQIVHRARARLRRLAATDPRFAPISHLSLLAGPDIHAA